MARRGDGDVDRRERGQAEARLGIGEDDRSRVDVAANCIHEPRRESRDGGRVGAAQVEKAAAEHRREEGRSRERGAFLECRPSPEHAQHQGSDGSDDTEPGDPRRRGVLQHVLEVARVHDLEEHPRAEHEREQDRPDEPRENPHAACESEREREEPRGAPCLRDRDEIGELGEEERHEHDGEHRKRAADDVRSPAPARGEAGERDQEERGDRDGTRAREDLGREVVRRVRVDDELTSVLVERALELVCIRRYRARVVHDRPQPEHEERRGSDERAERKRPRAEILPFPQRAHGEEPDERDPEEDRVRRMDDCEHEARGRRRSHEPQRGRAHRLERQRERGGHQELPRRGGGERQEDVRAAHSRREADHRHLRPRGHPGRPRAPEERPARLERHDDGERRKDRREVHDNLLGVFACDLRDERDEPVPERERIPGVEAAVRELGDALERERVELEELPHAREVKEPVALDGRRGHPDDQPDDSSPEERPCSSRHCLRAWPPAEAPHHETRERNGHEQHERQGQRRAERERDEERREHDGECPGESRRDAAHAERPRQ